MSLPGELDNELVGLAFLLAFTAAWTLFLWLPSLRPGLHPHAGISRFVTAIGAALERGRRLHLSLGHGGLTSPSAAASLAALGLLRKLAPLASQGDLPMLATSGSGELALLSELTASQAGGRGGDAALSGPTPLAYAGGALSWMADDDCAAQLVGGRLGGEIALLLDAAEMANGNSLAGSDSFPGQAALYAAASEPLVGEELYAAAAYLHGDPAHLASLHAQDVLRWLVILAILAAIVMKVLA